MVNSILILHLSDLHFGPNSRFIDLKPEDLSQKMCMAVADECNRHDIDKKISLVIITGDIAENARSEEYDLARSFFENLSIDLKIDHDKFIFVPGNHDVNWNACKRVEIDQDDQRFSEEEFASRINGVKFKNFELFIKDFYGVPIEEKGHSINYGSYLYNINGLKLSIAALNSSERESHRKEDHIGFLGDNHARSLMNEWYGDKFDSWLKIIAIHHNPVPTVPENVKEGIAYLESLKNEVQPKI